MIQYLSTNRFWTLLILLILKMCLESSAQEKTIVLKNGETRKASFIRVKERSLGYSIYQFSKKEYLPLDELECYYKPDNPFVWVPVADKVYELVLTGPISVFLDVRCNQYACYSDFYLKKGVQFEHVFTATDITINGNKKKQKYIEFFKDDNEIYEVVTNSSFIYSIENFREYFDQYNLKHPEFDNPYSTGIDGKIVLYSHNKRISNGCTITTDSVSYTFKGNTKEEISIPENESIYLFNNKERIRSIIATQYFTKYYEVFKDEYTDQCHVERRSKRKATKMLMKLDRLGSKIKSK